MIKGYGSRKDKKGKNIHFRWLEENGSVDLGAPDKIVAEKGNQRDGGCNLFFSTQESSIGIEERFALYLYANRVSEVTLKIWGAYLKTEPQHAARDLKKIIKDLEYLSLTVK